MRRQVMIAAFVILALLANLVQVMPAYAEEQLPADRVLVVTAWQQGGAQARLAAEAALLGSDDQVRAFLAEGWSRAQRLDQRDALASVISGGGPSLRAKAQLALDADAAGDQSAIATFLESGWQGPSAIDARVSVNQLMTAGGDQVKQAAQAVLDAGDTQALLRFLESGWQTQWNTDQRLRINQAVATGGSYVRAAGQQALDAGTPEALEAFLSYGWAVASARDDEVATLQDLLGQAQAAGALAAQETANATGEAGRAKDAAAAARRSAAEAAAATAAARDNMAEAKAQAKRAAVAAQKAADAAQVAVQAAAAANRAARAASTAAARAAQMASKASQKATEAYQYAAAAMVDASWADDARQAAQAANAIALQTRDFAELAQLAATATTAGQDAINAANLAAENAIAAAASNDEAVRYANAAGAAANEAIAAAARARANAERALRAARAAENYLRVAIDAAYKARDAALRAAANAEAAAIAALYAAAHAGDAALAAQLSTEYANKATTAAQDAVNTAILAAGVFDAARTADVERLTVARDEGLENARAANVEYEAQQRVADWDVDQAAKRDAETNRLIAVAVDPATARATAVASARKVALNLAAGQGAWTKQAALAALSGTEDIALEFARTGIPAAAAQDNRIAVMNLAVTDNSAVATAARTALAGSDQTVATFLRTQNYPGRFSADRMKVNQILTAAKTAGDVVLAQKAQQALDTDTLQALRDFLDTGQYTAAVIGERVRVNQILTNPESGPEVKAAAQLALDGPAPGLRQFLSTGQFTAAERDYESAIHVAVAAGLLQKISQVAETAVKDALRAQSVAAGARSEAAKAASYAQQAVDSANRAAGYAQQARNYASQAVASVAKAAAAVKTARTAATQATTSARSAIRSATWAVASYQIAVDAAESANRAARIAYDYAIAAGEDAEAAVAAQNSAYKEYENAYYTEVAICGDNYSSTPVADFEEYWGMPEGEGAKNCVANLTGDPEELAERAYVNSALCAMFPDGSQEYQNCINSTLDPLFHGMQQLILVFETVKGLVLQGAIIVGLGVGGLCVVTVCGLVAGALLTMFDVGTEIYRFIKGDQSLATTMLNIGTVAVESLVLAGIGKVLSAGFRALKAAHAAARTGSSAVSLILKGQVDVKHLKALPGAWRMRAGNYSTDRDTAFFWSGRTWVGPGDEDFVYAGGSKGKDVFSDEIATAMGGTTLEMLMRKRGIIPAEWDADNKIVEAAWNDVSAAYARAASGVVRVILGTDLRKNPLNVWEKSEYRALCLNPNVTKIIKIDLTTRIETELSCAQFR